MFLGTKRLLPCLTHLSLDLQVCQPKGQNILKQNHKLFLYYPRSHLIQSLEELQSRPGHLQKSGPTSLTESPGTGFLNLLCFKKWFPWQEYQLFVINEVKYSVKEKWTQDWVMPSLRILLMQNTGGATLRKNLFLMPLGNSRHSTNVNL